MTHHKGGEKGNVSGKLGCMDSLTMMVAFTWPYFLGSLARFLSSLSWLSLDISQQESSAYLFHTRKRKISLQNMKCKKISRIKIRKEKAAFLHTVKCKTKDLIWFRLLCVNFMYSFDNKRQLGAEY